MEILLAAGIPSAITAFCFWIIERKIQNRAEQDKAERMKHQKELDEKEKSRVDLQFAMLKALDGSLALSEARRSRESQMPSATEICMRLWSMNSGQSMTWKISCR